MVRKYFCKWVTPFKGIELRILFCIASMPGEKLVTQTKVAEILTEPVTTVNYHFKKFKVDGLLDKGNNLTDKCKRILRYFKRWDKTFDRKLRAHNIQIIVFLAKIPINFFEIKNSILKPFTNERYSGLKTEILNCQVLFYSPKKAVIMLPDIFGSNDEEIICAINEIIGQLIEALEIEFPGLKVDSYKRAKFSSMHVAILDSIIAELFILKNKRNFSNGRIAIDKSHGRYELEAINANTALEDIEILVKWEDLVRENERLKKLNEELDLSLKKKKSNNSSL